MRAQEADDEPPEDGVAPKTSFDRIEVEPGPPGERLRRHLLHSLEKRPREPPRLHSLAK